MKNKNEENVFDFLPENSIITYKKYKFDLARLNVTNEIMKSAVYSYDIYTNQFIYLIKDSLHIFNTKGKCIKTLDLPKMDKIRFCTCDKKNNYILCITENNLVVVFNLKKEIYVKYDPYDPRIEVRLGYLHGGFFIKSKVNEKKKEEEVDIGLIGNNSYRIVTVIMTGKNFTIKNTFASQKIPITEYYFNNIFNVLIIRNEFLGFSLINLKSSYCYSSCIELKINNILLTSKFYIQNIYNKLYFIHFTENLIEFYRLKNLKDKKEPKTIEFNKSEKMIDYELTQIQFYNNMMILYIDDNIRLYDIKADFNKKMGKIIIPESKREGFFDKIKVRGKFVIINNEIYKIKFLPENYKNKNISNTLETFFSLLRRKNTTNIVSTMLINLLKEYELSAFYAIFFKCINNYIKSKNEAINDDKKNFHEIMYKGHNSFYLSQDHIFALFNNEFDNLDNIKILQVMATVYNEYLKNNIKIDKDVFIPSLFFHLGQTDDFSCLDFILKNKYILADKSLGLYLIDRSKTMKEKKNRILAFDLGIEMLMLEVDDIDEVLFELNEEEKYEESANIVIDFYIGFKFDKKDKNIKGDINKHLKRFITTKLTSGNKAKGRVISIGEEENDF